MPRLFHHRRPAALLLLWCGLLGSHLRHGIAEEVVVGGEEPRPQFHVENDQFMKDGEPFVIRAGNMDYARVVPEYHHDRLQRMKALGLNAVALYIPWNYHERPEGVFGKFDKVTQYLQEIQEEGMLAIVRPGPYICGEWDFGGFPSYLLTRHAIQFRTFDTQFLSAVRRWFDRLLPEIRPYLYSNGGPIVIVQVENEYGMWGDVKENEDDARYMHFLLDLLQRHLGEDVVYTTVDGLWSTTPTITKGSPWRRSPRVLATLDGPAEPGYLNESLLLLEDFNPPGKQVMMISELWVGWFTRWNQDTASNRTAKEIQAGMEYIVENGISFSMYMAHGGTNFGFTSGANWNPLNPGSYKPQITSYDYIAPISEAGRHNIGSDGRDIFVTIRNTIAAGYGVELPPEPQPIPVVAYGNVTLTEAALLFENLESLSSKHIHLPAADSFPHMEQLGQIEGLMVLVRPEQHADFDAFNLSLHPNDVKDRGQVFVDGAEIGTVYSGWVKNTTMKVPPGSTMQLVVENMGHANFNFGMMEDIKGWHAGPPVLGDWDVYCLPLSPKSLETLDFGNNSHNRIAGKGPVFHRGTFEIGEGNLADTYLDTEGLQKGVAWVNGHALGRYWETAGPQHALYIPAPFLMEGENSLIILELHNAQPVNVTLTAGQRWIKKRHKRKHHWHHWHRRHKSHGGNKTKSNGDNATTAENGTNVEESEAGVANYKSEAGDANNKSVISSRMLRGQEDPQFM